MKRVHELKKIIAVMLSAAMVFCFTACGKPEEKPAEDIPAADPAEYPADEYEAEFDFAMEISEKFEADEIFEEVNFEDLESETEAVEERLVSALSETGSEFEMFSEYIEDEEDEIDKLVYAFGMEENDSELMSAEAGAYHDSSDDGYYQYVALFSRNYGEDYTEDDVMFMVDCFEKFGVKVSAQRLTQAIEIGIANAKENEEYYSLSQYKNAEGDSYGEEIYMGLETYVDEEDGQVFFYVMIERDRQQK